AAQPLRPRGQGRGQRAEEARAVTPITRAFEGKKAFIPFVMAGDPDLETSADIVRALDAAGADVIELGVPFSDPIADGPVNQHAAERAIAAGATLAKTLAMARALKQEGLRAPLVLFTYLNPLLAYGRPPEGVDA